MSYLDMIDEYRDYIHESEEIRIESCKILKEIYDRDPSLMFLFNVSCYKVADKLTKYSLHNLKWFLDRKIYENKTKILKNPYLLLTVLKAATTEFLEIDNQRLAISKPRAIHNIFRLNEEELNRFGSWTVNAIKYLPELITLPHRNYPKVSWLLIQTWHKLDKATRNRFINDFICETDDKKSSEEDAKNADYILSFVENCKLSLEDYYALFNNGAIGDHLIHYLVYPQGRKGYWKKVFNTLNENEALLIAILCLTYQNVNYKSEDVFNLVNDYLKSYDIIPANIISLKLMKQKDVIDSLYDTIMKNKILKENDDETDSSDFGNSLLLLE